MPDNFFTGLLYGPQGPELNRRGDDTWGKSLEEAFEGKDNENFIEKTGIISKYTFVCATFGSIIDIVLLNPKGGVTVALQRMKFHYLPWLGATVAYQATTNMVCSLRGGKSDDHYNHFAGGFAAGAVVGRCARCFRTGLVMGALVAIAGGVYKDSRLKNYEVCKAYWKEPQQHGNPFTYKNDYTTNWFPERPGYWARTPEEAEEVYKRGQLSTGKLVRLW